MTPFPIGSLLKNTDTYVLSICGNKVDKYECPGCHKDVVFCNGPVKGKYFRHKGEHDNSCTHYNHPGESEIHKEGKLIMKHLLETGGVCMERTCPTCQCKYRHDIPPKTENSFVKIEEKIKNFDNGLKQADVMYVVNRKRHSIFEIYNTHLTDPKNRPEPWYEVDAKELPYLVENSDAGGGTWIKCLRKKECEKCECRAKAKAEEARAKAEEARRIAADPCPQLFKRDECVCYKCKRDEARAEAWRIAADPCPHLFKRDECGCEKCKRDENWARHRTREIKADLKQQYQEYDDLVKYESNLVSQISTRERNRARDLGLPQDDEHHTLARINILNKELDLINNGIEYDRDKLWDGWDDSYMTIQLGVSHPECEI